MHEQVSGFDGQNGRVMPSGMVDFGGNDLVNVIFYRKKVPDPKASVEKGRPVFVALDYVRIQHPGEKDYSDRPVSGPDDPAAQRWPHHWARYQKGLEPAPPGSPVEILFPLNPEIAGNLHSIGVHTIEQLSGLTAHGLQTIGMGATEWQKKAKDFLSAASGGAGMHRINKENENLKNQLEVQGNQIALLKAQLDQLLAERRGVPPAMIPPAAPTIAQQYAEQVPDFDSDESAAEMPDEEWDSPPVQAPADSGQPLFVEPVEETVTSAEPKRGGWPKGKPRK